MPEIPGSVDASSGWDIAVVGAGAAGLMAAIQAGRLARARGGTGAGAGIVALDGARKPGAKILVAGGGRCNLTHDRVDESAFAGSSRKAIRKVLLRFGVQATVDFFREIGVFVKREETGKLFPVTDDARTVLDALLGATGETGVDLRPAHRVESVVRDGQGYTLSGAWGGLRARRVILATGGRSLPKSGSDGHGYEIARSLGHTTTPLSPALVPLVLPDRHFLRGLSGLSAPVAIEVQAGTGRRIASFEGPLLCTHFGVSGPAVLDASRYWIEARAGDGAARLVVNWLPGETFESADTWLRDLGNAGAGAVLARRLPDRLAVALCDEAGVNPALPGSQIPRDARRSLAETLTRMVVTVSGDRGFEHAEATAGGVPLSEIRLETMESRVTPGLFLCGEICDVDGRIGGFNFQWAWSSGFVAGIAAAASCSGAERGAQRDAATPSPGDGS